MDLGDEIKARRARLGLTLDGLAERTGVSRAMLSEIERGTKNPTIRVVCQIAEGIGATVSELIGEASPTEIRTPTIVRAAERQTLVDPHSGATRQLLAPPYLRHGVEVLWYTLPPHAATGTFPAHRPGTVEQLTVVRGALRCRLGGEEALLAAAREHEAYLAGEVLATAVAYDAAEGAGATIDGLQLQIAVRRV